MWKPLIGLLFSGLAFAQISFNTAADLGNNGGSTNTLTASFTAGSGTNRLLAVCLVGDTIGGSDDISSVTYNGNAMALVAKNTGGASGFNRFTYLYYILNPTSGAHNVVITAGSNHYLIAGAADYAGVNQSGQPDASNTAATTSSNTLATSVTTVANNDWTILCGNQQFAGSAPTAGTGSTRRTFDATFGDWGLFDSNAAITPAGSTSMTIASGGGTNNIITVIGAFSPATATTTVRHRANNQ